MPLPSTMTPIATNTLTAVASSVTFSSIPSTYTDLVLVLQGSFDSADDVRFRFNGDTGSNYSYTNLYGTGSSAGSFRAANQTSGIGDFYGNVTTTLGNSVQIFQFMNYANTTTNKTVLIRSNQAGSGVDATGNLWRSTSAITSITFAKGSSMSGTWQSGSTFTLYGIKAA